MKKCVIIAFTAVACFFAISCSKDSSSNENPVPDIKDSYEVNTSGSFSISVLEHSDGGYRWSVESITPENIIKLTSTGVKSTSTDPTICGAPNIVTFTFTGLSKGTTKLKIVEAQSSSNEVLTAKTIIVDVK